MVEFDRSAFIGKFQEEAQDLLQRLNEGVIQLEAEPDNRELIDQMMRDAHTVKGSSRMVGLIEISDVAHRLEDFMIKVRDGEMKYTPAMSDYFFEALDAIVYLADNAGQNVDNAIDLDALQVKLTALAAGGTDAAKAAEAGAPAPTVEPEPAPTADKPKKKAKKAESEPQPAAAAAEPAEEVVEVVDDGRDDDDTPARAQRAGELKSKVQATIRIKTGQVDNLLNLVSEVVISQIKAEQRVNEVRSIQATGGEVWQTWVRLRSLLTSLGGEDALEGLSDEMNLIDSLLSDQRRAISTYIKGYADDVSRTSMVVNDLQEQGMRMRMLPANTIFQSFPRAVRDLAKQFKKDIELFVEGGDTELDKKVLEEINDPLVHIMRNAVDHGIEDPETRVKRGKPAKGTINLAARQEGDRIVIEISDDGNGIDPEKVKASAIRKGYLTEAEASAMSDREAMYLIFEAGFSTAAIITEISGRGVGMDVVREFIVDAFVGEQQIVIKPLGSHLSKVDNVAGVTILGAGEVVPILNVPDLMTNARSRSGQRAFGQIERTERSGPRKILICEDSFTTRELERSIFEAAGYQVETAMDGAMGFSKLKEGLQVDAVVTDVQMPNMTGFELTKAIKSDPVLQVIPVIIVTSLERDEEKAEGIDAGADAYITKSVFNQDTLLDTVERLIR